MELEETEQVHFLPLPTPTPDALTPRYAARLVSNLQDRSEKGRTDAPWGRKLFPFETACQHQRTLLLKKPSQEQQLPGAEKTSHPPLKGPCNEAPTLDDPLDDGGRCGDREGGGGGGSTGSSVVQ
jgi:hypothetical protein